ncbi:membrane protein [Clostridia bacterium]|nr:membrane protein [Clostridia bacterium]
MKALQYKRILLLAVAPAAYGLSCLASAFPYITEWVYSTSVYPVISGLFGGLSALVPFSLAELLLCSVVMFILTYVFIQLRLLIKKRSGRKKRLLKLFLNSVIFFGLWYGLFVLICGFNYHRLSFAYYSGLHIRDSSAGELAALCGELVESAGELRASVEVDELGIMKSSFASPYQTAIYAGGAYGFIGEKYPILNGFTPRPKPVRISRVMSYLNITGIFIPFTFEANVNTDVPDFNIPSSMMHELAHYKGFMREDEANFISYLACLESGNTEFEYSGVMLALIHSSNALYSANKEAYYDAMRPLSEEVWADLSANSAYWRQFEGPVAEVSTTVNNTYLQVNRQADGVKSYGRMVDLLLADYRARHGLE